MPVSTFTVVFDVTKMPPPYAARFPRNVTPVSVVTTAKEPAPPLLKMPPPDDATLSSMNVPVMLATVSDPALPLFAMAPPPAAEFARITPPLTVIRPKLRMAPPSPAGARLLVIVTLVSVNTDGPAMFQMAPPPDVPLATLPSRMPPSIVRVSALPEFWNRMPPPADAATFSRICESFRRIDLPPTRAMPPPCAADVLRRTRAWSMVSTSTGWR